MTNIVYEDIDILMMNNRDIRQLDATLSYYQKGKVVNDKISGDLNAHWSILDLVITFQASYQFRGTCVIDGFVHDFEIKNIYIDGKRHLVLVLHKCFHSNKEKLRALIFDEKLKKSFVNITNALARAYIHLSRLTHTEEDISDIRALVDSLPEWTRISTFDGVRIKSDPWAVIDKALELKDEYYFSLGV